MVALAREKDGYLPRLFEARLARYMDQAPGLLITGPRASGKTTTVGRVAASTARMELPQVARAFADDPDAALAQYEEPVLIDEWQLAPGVIGAVRRAIDAEPRPGRFLIAGSAWADTNSGFWPATGRVVRLPIFPMTVAELRGDGGHPSFLDRLAAALLGEGQASDEAFERALAAVSLRADEELGDYVAHALVGGFPVPALQLTDDEVRHGWFTTYIDHALTRDVRQIEDLDRSRDPVRMRRYLSALAFNSGGAPEHKTVYDAARIRRETAEAYEALFTSLGLLDVVPAWTSNRLKRLTLTPKRYLVDTGLMAALANVDRRAAMRDGDLLGRLIDTFAVAQLRSQAAASPHSPTLHHLRTEAGRREVDLIVELRGGEIIAFEFKAAVDTGAREARHLAWLRDELGDRFLGGFVLSSGPFSRRLDDRLAVLPLAALWHAAP